MKTQIRKRVRRAYGSPLDGLAETLFERCYNAGIYKTRYITQKTRQALIAKELMDCLVIGYRLGNNHDPDHMAKLYLALSEGFCPTLFDEDEE